MSKKNHVMLLRDKTHVRSFSGVLVASAQAKRKAKYLESQYLLALENAKRLEREVAQSLAKGNVKQANERVTKLEVLVSRIHAIGDELTRQNRVIAG